jgi:omega-6 fatty acid desaturase (delta-12 desaturase)
MDAVDVTQTVNSLKQDQTGGHCRFRGRDAETVTDTAALKELKRTIIDRHAKPDDLSGLVATVATVAPLTLLWVCVPLSAQVSYWLTAGVVALISLFLLRAFVLMHECGHGSLFRSAGLNSVFGFVFGVLTAMPQYVWSKHHLFHHATNGNWARYRGPLDIVTVDDYAAMTRRQQRRYRHSRSIWLAPFGGFVYLFLNPRITWLRGSVGLVRHIVQRKWEQPGVSIRSHALYFETPYWSSRPEYWHMLWNNVVLLGLIALMAWLVGPTLFLVCYVTSISLAGGAGIALFTVQHNFEHSYASANEGWDINRAALHGTSMLVLPRWLNWFTANIAYHHVHHLSARVPFYRLVACHIEHQHLFGDVTRLTLSQIPSALKCVLWDTRARRIISVFEHVQQSALRA